MTTPDVYELIAGTGRLSLPLLCILAAAVLFFRVGTINVALDGQIVLAAITYACFLNKGYVILGAIVAILISVCVGSILILAKELFDLNQLLVGLAFLYCSQGIARVICQLVFGNPNYAPAPAHHLGSGLTSAILLGMVITTACSVRWIRPLRLSKVLYEARGLARLDGVNVVRLALINGAIASALAGGCAVYLVEQGGSFTAGVSGERGFLALALVMIANRRPAVGAILAVLFAAAQKLAPALRFPSDLLAGLPYMGAVILLVLAGLFPKIGGRYSDGQAVAVRE